jgi:hypothetical protein
MLNSDLNASHYIYSLKKTHHWRISYKPIQCGFIFNSFRAKPSYQKPRYEMDSPTSTIVFSPANSWSSGCSSASTLLEDTHLPSDLGVEISQNQSEDHFFDTGAFYLACVQGGDILQACVASSDVDLNSPLPGRCGSNVFHEVLRIPADQFEDGKGEVI